MNKIIVHTKTGCPWCVEAKKWLTKHGFKFEVKVHDDYNERLKFYESCGDNVGTVPQIFIQFNENDKPIRIGGYQELIRSDYFISKTIKFNEDF